MIVIGSSAVIAIFRQKDDAEDYTRSIAGDDDPVMSAAALNFDDCFAYALAKTMDAPLLCKGNDFPATDISIA